MAIHPNQKECRICGNRSGNQVHQIKEMFLGTRDTFDYVECATCATLQIQSVPDLRPYYPTHYYSFQPPDGNDAQSGGWGRRWARRAGQLVRKRAADYHSRGGQRSPRFSDRLLSSLLKPLSRVVVGYPEYLVNPQLNLAINRQSRILDVGAGAGSTLVGLSHFGFQHLLGIDPFLEKEAVLTNGIRILKATVYDLNQRFDLILANHSLEHAEDPIDMLREIHRLLKPRRYAIIRIPVVSEAWRRYGTNWVQLDAPRHLFLFTATAFSEIARNAGFEVKQIVFDSTAFQFWGSEQYRRDIPLVADNSYFINPEESIFTREQITSYEKEAASLNSRREGDQAAFYLFKNQDQQN